jgi:hypothetical protein
MRVGWAVGKNVGRLVGEGVGTVEHAKLMLKKPLALTPDSMVIQ